jgi:hypothetical protein
MVYFEILLKKNYKHIDDISYEEFNNKAYENNIIALLPQLAERYLPVV